MRSGADAKSASEQKRAEEGDDVVEGNVIADVLAKASQVWSSVRDPVVRALARAPPKEKSPKELELDRLAALIINYRDLAAAEDEPSPHLVDKPAFDVLVIILILLNSLFLSLEVDSGDREDGRETWLIVMEWVYVCFFWAEIGAHIAAKSWRWLFDDWRNIPGVLVTLLCTLDAIFWWAGDAGSGYLRMASVFRVVDIPRKIKFVGNHTKVLDLLFVNFQILQNCWKTVLWVLFLVFMFVYTFGIIVTAGVGHNTEVYGNYRKLSGGWDHEENFGSMSRSLQTLMQVMTLNKWSSEVVRHVLENQWVMSMFFLMFVFLSTVGLLNVVVSVMVEGTIRAVKKNDQTNAIKEKKNRSLELESLRELFNELDDNGDEEVDPDEFLAACEDPQVRYKFRQLGLPMEDAIHLFDVMDGGGQRTLKIQEFIDGCMALKGPATSKDMLKVQAKADTLAGKLDTLADSLNSSEMLMEALDEVTKRLGQRNPSAIRSSRKKRADAIAGRQPVVQPKRLRPGLQEAQDLSGGNIPQLPMLPDFLRSSRETRM